MDEELPELTPEDIADARARKLSMRRFAEESRVRRQARARKRREVTDAVSSRLTTCPVCGYPYTDPVEEDSLHQPYGADPIGALCRHCSACDHSVYVDLMLR